MFIISVSPKIRFGKETFMLGNTPYYSIGFLHLRLLILSKEAKKLHLMTMSEFPDDPHYVVIELIDGLNGLNPL